MNKIILIIIFYIFFSSIQLFSQELYSQEETNAYYLEIKTRDKTFENKIIDTDSYFSYGGISRYDIYSLLSFALYRSFGIFLNIPDTSMVKITLYNQYRDSTYELFNRHLPPNLYDFHYNLKKNNLLVDKNSLYRIFIEARNNVTDSIFEDAIKNNTDLDTLYYGKGNGNAIKYLMNNKSIIFTNKIYIRLDTLKEY